jgi:hypothetical protein
MTEATRSEILRYRDQAFAIHHLISDCPPGTVIRELAKNAEENAVLMEPPGRIEWFTEMVEGVPKLGLFNEGPGMDGEELSRLMDLASTGKRLGIDENYGQGGKISALKVSPHGVVYRSCKAGRVSQIILVAEHRPGADFPVYVKKRPTVPTGKCSRPLDRDWTEVVLLGRNALHDTVAELLPETRVKNWLMRHLNTRFYRFPAGIVIRAANLSTGSEDNRTARGLEMLTTDCSEKSEDVAAEHPRLGMLRLRYCKLKGQYGENDAGHSRAKTMDAYGLGTRGDHICLVWKNECYDVHVGWARISGAFGVTFGSSNIAIHIQLSDDAPVKNNTYRDAILDRRGEHQSVRVEDFADLVRRHRPRWLIRYIEREARKNANPAEVMKRLHAYLKELNVNGQHRALVELGGEDEGEAPQRRKRGAGSSAGTPYMLDQAPRSTRPAKGLRTPSPLPGIPQVLFAEDPAILEELSGRAALYRLEDNTVLLNPQHAKYLEDLEKIYADVGPGADRRALARQLFDEEYSFNAGKFVIQAWLFKDRPHWEDRAWHEAASSGALTVHLASTVSLDESRRRLRQKLNSRKLDLLPAKGR